jgi:hypothetical protein
MAGRVFANFIFPLEETLSKAEADVEIAKENEEKALCEERASHLAGDKDALADHLGECVQALEAEKTRRASVEGRLTTIMGLASIAGTIVFGSILAQATGSVHPQRTSLRWLMAIGCAYLTAQIASAILAAVQGLSRRGYLSEKASEILPLKDEADLVYFRRRVASVLRIVLDHQNHTNKKVTQMAVAHQAMKNFVWGLLAVALCGTFYGITARPTDDVVEAFKKNHDLVKIIQGPQGLAGVPGPRGEPGPVGPKGEPCKK